MSEQRRSPATERWHVRANGCYLACRHGPNVFKCRAHVSHFSRLCRLGGKRGG
jgi:hypothetical protein